MYPVAQENFQKLEKYNQQTLSWINHNYCKNISHLLEKFETLLEKSGQVQGQEKYAQNLFIAKWINKHETDNINPKLLNLFQQAEKINYYSTDLLKLNKELQEEVKDVDPKDLNTQEKYLSTWAAEKINTQFEIAEFLKLVENGKKEEALKLIADLRKKTYLTSTNAQLITYHEKQILSQNSKEEETPHNNKPQIESADICYISAEGIKRSDTNKLLEESEITPELVSNLLTHPYASISNNQNDNHFNEFDFNYLENVNLGLIYQLNEYSRLKKIESQYYISKFDPFLLVEKKKKISDFMDNFHPQTDEELMVIELFSFTRDNTLDINFLNLKDLFAFVKSLKDINYTSAIELLDQLNNTFKNGNLGQDAEITLCLQLNFLNKKFQNLEEKKLEIENINMNISDLVFEKMEKIPTIENKEEIATIENFLISLLIPDISSENKDLIDMALLAVENKKMELV